MKPIKQYVADQLCTLVEEFPKIQINCHYDELDDTFGAKILPPLEFFENQVLSYRMADLLSDLLHKYPNESIGFYTEGSTVNVEEFDYTLTGKDYVPHLLPTKNQKIEVVVPKRKRREPLHPDVGRTIL